MKAKKMAEKYISTAKVIDGILILSLPDALSPVVWQMELGQSKSSALEIRTADDGKFILTLKTPRQDVLEIATYTNRDSAIKALLVTSQALEKAQGQLKSGQGQAHYQVPAVSYTKSSGGGFWNGFKKVMSIIGVILASLLLLSFILFVIGKVFMGGTTTTTANNTPSAPVSADEFFENR